MGPQHAPVLSEIALSWVVVGKLTHFVSCLEWDGNSVQLVSCLLNGGRMYFMFIKTLCSAG